MIAYENDASAYFLTNKNCCELLEKELEPYSPFTEGYCNSFGYELNTSFKRGQLNYQLLVEKFQTTQNGIVVPKNANEYIGMKLKVEGLNSDDHFSYGKNSMKRLFSSKKWQEKLPAPYYLKGKMENEKAIQMFQENQIDEFELMNGIATITIRSGNVKIILIAIEVEKYFHKIG